ncbi:metalloregulator ArsR/SmtB family transcription factor [Rhizobium sp. TRM96647]|uniref:ArsR/SmtB family transcription factor n=1 Tax=unclassified Rhizobium TaxID=2613769 RepID=UPI001E36DEC4|nr:MULTISPECIES: metalloregulator ArsR/SmtB family transcription factor [unclassified Rhizobium]MCD2181747.1 metalloregulator ArsR/SmtB family transcription factor [Rhizobium sp. GN54]MCV3736794.1 metalloregulator ArsR/SmtB family transcription factor [Rhizobium sp. TRM96647]MCV3756806.1 metalloregulator ArsR/SmtB family transcription factor [Rhizobium sp. TRM96650]
MGLDDIVEVLKTAGESTRLRLLALLSRGDLTVTDLTDILGQSQPRISRHLKLLAEAALIERYQEGAWAYFRLAHDGAAVALARLLLERTDAADPVFKRDAERLDVLKRARAEKAQAYFSRNAAEWDELRRLHVSEAEVEAALLELIGEEPVEAFLDLGTGTGRILQLFEGLYRRGVGVDASRDMLAVARANLDRAGITKASIRHGDIFNLPLERDEFDVVTIHQVLHFLDEPSSAIAEAARMLKPAGRLVIIDLAPHGLEHLRDEHAHLRLGFSHQQMQEWLEQAGLSPEQAIDLRPAGAGPDALTVTIWLARDQRVAADHAEPLIAIGRRH